MIHKLREAVANSLAPSCSGTMESNKKKYSGKKHQEAAIVCVSSKFAVRPLQMFTLKKKSEYTYKKTLMLTSVAKELRRPPVWQSLRNFLLLFSASVMWIDIYW